MNCQTINKEMIGKALQIIYRRITKQGVRVTILWLYGRGLPALTGVPLLQFSKITPNLYVGPQYRKQGLRLLQTEGIHAVVNMREEKDDQALGLAPEEYCYLPTPDDEAPCIEQLRQGVEFIQRIIQKGGKVYIHCGAGVGRAPTMAAAYLIHQGMHVEEAIATIRAIRPFIFITPPQLQQLYRYYDLIQSNGRVS
jgi:dual specificity MAP kinase phosphatase